MITASEVSKKPGAVQLQPLRDRGAGDSELLSHVGLRPTEAARRVPRQRFDPPVLTALWRTRAQSTATVPGLRLRSTGTRGAAIATSEIAWQVSLYEW